jgi:hypothetical protein
MPKPTSRPKTPADINHLAHELVRLSTLEKPSDRGASLDEISRVMRQMSKGGKISGKKRLKTMTAKQRRLVAIKAAAARWKKKKPLSK